MMNGIDIASYQKNIDLSVVPCDFVIIKATQGTKYVNPDFRRAYEQAHALGKCIGFYHYASQGGAVNEAKHFLATVDGREGILVLDWESGDNVNYGNLMYVKEFLETVYIFSGRTPLIYMSKSVCRKYNWAGFERYPLWVAQYANNNPTGYQTKPWTDANGYGAWTAPTIFQYSSKGRLAGWAGNLDLNLAYITPDEWRALQSAHVPFQPYAGTVSASWLRVRSGPSADYPVVTHSAGEYHLENGLCVAVLEEKNGWARIGPDRWVSARYLKR